ncbi:MAG: glycosyltransferase family protein [Pseudomonadota bacterium]
MKIVAIVQARMTSTRLPGKVLKSLGDRLVLDHVLRRVTRTPGVDEVCCATVDDHSSDKIVALCDQTGVVAFKGSETDVLGRYVGAARQLDADVVVRVTSDCPLTDPKVNGQVIEHFLETGADYACNNSPPSWPHGLDCEVISRAALERAARKATRSEEREHVTPWLRMQDDVKKVNLFCPLEGLAHHRWTLDTPDDYQFFREIFEYLEDTDNVGWQSILKIVEDLPELAAINRESKER